MDKARSSRRLKLGRRYVVVAFAVTCLLGVPRIFGSIKLSHAEALRIGKKVWQNECKGTVAGLTSWNAGENFASLGIGHFIWYPKGMRGPFDESFPKFVDFASSRGAKLPAVAMPGNACPWNSRSAFNAAAPSEPMRTLRAI